MKEKEMNDAINPSDLSIDHQEFLQMLENGDYLKPFPGEIFRSDFTIEKVREISDKFPFKPFEI